MTAYMPRFSIQPMTFICFAEFDLCYKFNDPDFYRDFLSPALLFSVNICLGKEL